MTSCNTNSWLFLRFFCCFFFFTIRARFTCFCQSKWWHRWSKYWAAQKRRFETYRQSWLTRVKNNNLKALKWRWTAPELRNSYSAPCWTTTSYSTVKKCSCFFFNVIFWGDFASSIIGVLLKKRLAMTLLPRAAALASVIIRLWCSDCEMKCLKHQSMVQGSSHSKRSRQSSDKTQSSSRVLLLIFSLQYIVWNILLIWGHFLWLSRWFGSWGHERRSRLEGDHSYWTLASVFIQSDFIQVAL